MRGIPVLFDGNEVWEHCTCLERAGVNSTSDCGHALTTLPMNQILILATFAASKPGLPVLFRNL